ncbi:hypothetical protein KFL_009800040 [Klebsormidium nitens]|uniref:PHD-type domain-containing protein n=1 Tax=Klebsormidium nitens TaxID=105231 RepID=A0A1Y1IN39_KLENI|nr:hypothetical protein KFL_009800040 [Klebsormidium nitens]|eukprot:GAQ92325.1 hypothetical protein KFL_009800040 [Klebsormidium nitens]
MHKSNGLTERLVRTIKAGITKFGSEAGRRTWDEWLPWMVMGYRMSRQAALAGYSPYFLTGNPCWHARRSRSYSGTIQILVTRGAYKVHQVGANGRLVLLGADGTLFKEHSENCASSHNPNIDLTVDSTLTGVPASHACQVCKSAGNPSMMLLCDYSLEGYHMGCLEPAVKKVPDGMWMCPRCREAEAQRVWLALASGSAAGEWGKPG